MTVHRRGVARRSRLTGEQRRESILVAATEVFAAVGYRRARVADIAARLDVSEPVIFQNFGSKAALFAAVVDRASARIGDDLDDLVDHFGSVAGLLTLMVSAEHLAAVHAPGSMGVLFADAAGLTGEPEVEAAASRARRRFADALAELLERGQRDGDIRADVDPTAGAWWLVSLVATQKLRAADIPDYGAVEAQLADLTHRLLLTDRAR